MDSWSRWGGNFSIFVFCSAFAYVGQALIKHGLQSVGQFRFQDPRAMVSFFTSCASDRNIWIGVFCVGLGFLMWMAFLSRLELSQAMPMLAFSYVPWLFIGHYFFKEQISPLRILGVILITLGVFLRRL